MAESSFNNVVEAFQKRDVSYRDKMAILEKAMIDAGNIIDEIEIRHYFAHGTYVREMHIPKGVVVTGKIHRHSCVNIVSKGKVKVVTEEGDHLVEAPYTFVSGPGVKKAAYAIEDTIILNVHPWDGPEDLDLIEQSVIVPSYEALDDERKESVEWHGES